MRISDWSSDVCSSELGVDKRRSARPWSDADRSEPRRDGAQNGLHGGSSAQFDRLLADHQPLDPHFGGAIAPQIAGQAKAFAGLDLGARQPARFHTANRRQNDVPDLALPAHLRAAVRIAPRSEEQTHAPQPLMRHSYAGFR